jgi:prefoldin subunit 5
MMSCGSTTRLTRPSSFGAYLLGLIALPLLPGFAAAQSEAPVPVPPKPVAPIQVQIVPAAPQHDGDSIQAELAAAQAELAMLQKQIQLRQAHIKEMEARLAKMKVKEGEQPKEGAKMVVEVVGGAKNAGEAIIILRKTGDHWEIVQPAMKPTASPPAIKGFRIEEKDGVIRVVTDELGKAVEAPSIRLAPTTALPAPMPPRPPEPVPSGLAPTPPALPRATAPAHKSETENRLDKLEEHLQRIIKELDSLRKEMKQPGRTSAVPAVDEPRVPVIVDDGGNTPGKVIEVLEIPKPVPPAPVPASR